MPGRLGQRADHDTGPAGQLIEALTHQLPEASFHPVAHDSRSDGLADHKTDRRPAIPTGHHMGDEGRAGRTLAKTDGLSKILAVAHAIAAGEQNSGGKLRAAAPATRCENGATGAGAHPEAKTVLFATATDVRLVSTFRHEKIPVLEKCAVRSTATARPQGKLFMGTRQLSVRTIQRYGGHSRRSN